MSGFEVVETPDQEFNSGSTQQAAVSLMQLFDMDDSDENKLDDEGQAASSGDEPENLGAQDGQEQPESGDSEQDASDSDESEDANEPVYTVKVNGEEHKVTLSELQKGFQRQSDYTRSKQQLAEQQRELEARQQQIEQIGQQRVALIQQLQTQLDQLIPPEPDWQKLSAESPQEYARQRAAWDNLQQYRSQVQAEQQRLMQEHQQQWGQQYRQYLLDQRERLVKANEKLQDPENYRKFFQEIGDYAVNEYGFTPQEIQSIGDHRLVLMAQKAMKYDQLQRKNGGQAKGGQPPVLKPGAKNTEVPVSRNLRKARENLARSGSVEDAADAIMNML